MCVCVCASFSVSGGNPASAEVCLQVYEWEDKKGEGRMERGERIYAGVTKGEDPATSCICAKCVLQFVSLFVHACICVCVCIHRGYNRNLRVKTCSGHFTRTLPQIYGCASLLMGVSVFSREMLCVTQDKLLFVRTSVHKTKRFSEPHFGKQN